MEGLALFISALRWQDVFDIALNSYIIFRLYVLFRGTNVLRILIGIVFLWFFQRLAVSVGLVVTSWVMQGVTALAALIIIVVFRNEIRSVLQTKNWRTILWGFPKWADTPVETIVDSVFDLAQARIGALLVFPGREDLKDIVHGGVKWGGLISKEMIRTVFWRDNPVHDGAAVIEGRRIAEVGVLLPLSRRSDLPTMYGTRHRAALGLSEATDALVIVISEERGVVSAAEGSRIRAIRGRGELAGRLNKHIGEAPGTVGRKGRLRLEFAAAALASFVFVGAIWFSFTKGLDTLVTLEVPVEYMNRKASMKILNASVNAVKLNLGGSGALLKSLKADQVGVRLDLAEAIVGKNTFTLTPENVILPPGVVLKDVKPSVIDVTLDVPVQKTIPVQADWAGKLPANLILTKVRVTPARLDIVGESSVLGTMPTIYTEKISLDKIRESGSVTVRPALNPASLKIAPDAEDEITVQYTVVHRE
ncbi:MAG: DNA integrity scanning protein DisA nucleotide-binding domain protein [Deltaproteobacteria bacterium]|nr:DNA integrity scanning protein DisA nucleotide-binding domain protein [Deltaproteobacteria bacterium]MBW1815999.1 DNA integrity scanning protein DisA nucleotide-binding domain protein [Deltaproteobacteria bacterium]